MDPVSTTCVTHLATHVSQKSLTNIVLGTLPSNTEVPKALGKEHVKVVTLRSGKELTKTIQKESEHVVSKSETTPVVPVIENPRRSLEHQSSEVPTFVSPKSDYPLLFLEEAARKYSIESKVIVDPKTKVVTPSEPQEKCSALLTSKIPPKLKDPRSFTILYSIYGKEIGKASCELGASINLMPLSVFNTLAIEEATPITVTLQLTNRSIDYPKGKIEDVLVQVDKFIFMVDFIILDFEADNDILIILRRPFLAIGGTLIDVQKGELTVRLQDQKVTYNIFNSLKYPNYLEECLGITKIEAICHDGGIRKVCKLEEEDNDEIYEEIVEELDLREDESIRFDVTSFEFFGK
ncbi:uncharacterized protein LOC112499900 [Cynara cardunculus var. scolymus]|uniref:uncharacterized protein LOC112499900 n=1 Tax=Cynara cardunculus var. scolymus TaxID=59895 RepID=UPI000D62D599|nr:uncharacterized protein LOC112499900 [Cynara cardunculus var. scolymus]